MSWPLYLWRKSSGWAPKLVQIFWRRDKTVDLLGNQIVIPQTWSPCSHDTDWAIQPPTNDSFDTCVSVMWWRHIDNITVDVFVDTVLVYTSLHMWVWYWLLTPCAPILRLGNVSLLLTYDLWHTICKVHTTLMLTVVRSLTSLPPLSRFDVLFCWHIRTFATHILFKWHDVRFSGFFALIYIQGRATA
jgi:hypothetical protein